MAVPTSISELSTTPGSNPPAGSDSPSTLDDQLRTVYAFIRTLSDEKAASAAAVLLTGAQSIAGVKTFTDNLIASANATVGGNLSVTGNFAVAGNTSVEGAAYTPPIQPSHSATPTFDCATSNVFEPAALTSNVTSMTMSNAVGGQTVNIRFVQDATGGRTVAVPASAKVSGSVNIAANTVTWLIMTYSARASRWEGSWSQVPV